MYICYSPDGFSLEGVKALLAALKKYIYFNIERTFSFFKSALELLDSIIDIDYTRDKNPRLGPKKLFTQTTSPLVRQPVFIIVSVSQAKDTLIDAMSFIKY